MLQHDLDMTKFSLSGRRRDTTTRFQDSAYGQILDVAPASS